MFSPIFIFPSAVVGIQNDDDRVYMEGIYLAHEKILYGCAMNILHNENDVPDAINNACEKLIKKIPTLRGLDSCALKSYIVTTIENVSKDILRRQRRDRSLVYLDIDVIETIADERHTEESDLELLLNKDALYHALNVLPRKEADIIMWKYLNGLSDHEIASMLDIGDASVRAYLTKARRHLLSIIEEMIIDGIA